MKFMVKMLMLAAMTFPCASFARKLKPEVEKAMQKGALAEIRLKVVDDKGAPVTNAGVRAIMDMPSDEYSMFGKTDTNGEYVVRGKTNGNYIKFLVGKDGYYDSYKRMTYIQMYAEHDVKDGKWQPYGETQSIQLRRIRAPIELTCGTLFIDIGETNQWIGFDMLAKDFVRPFGKGENADFEIRAEWDGKPPIGSKMCYGELRFTQPFAGGYYVEKVVESSYPYVYEAKRNDGYAALDIKVVNRMGEPGSTRVPFREDSVLVTRTRCVVDEVTGKLKSANYGYIKDFMVSPSWKGKCTLRLFYVFNPTPNGRNLELDMKNNLCPNPGKIGQRQP